MGELLTVLVTVATLLAVALAIRAWRGLRARARRRTVPGAPTWHRVLRVVDGDTLDVEMSGHTVRVRVLGVDTPETVHPDKPVEFYGPEASAEAHRLLDGQWVQVRMDLWRREHVDGYGRLLAYVGLPDGTDYGWLMVVNGYAQEMTFAGQGYEHQRDYQWAEHLARTQHVGMWAPVHS